jgi:GTPase SAR1 family protein
MKEITSKSGSTLSAFFGSSETKAQSEVTMAAEAALTLSQTPLTSLQNRILEIAALNPTKATRISQLLQNPSHLKDTLCQLKELGIIAPTHKNKLLGGMIVGDEILMAVFKGGFEFVVNGNKKTIKSQLKEPAISARVQLPTEEWIEGTHTGMRMIGEPKYRIQLGFAKMRPKYTLIASGKGEFSCSTRQLQMTYTGRFQNNLFDDNSGTAVQIVTKNRITTRYTGSFKNGKKEGRGTFEKELSKQKGFYTYYEGYWEDDTPVDGTYYFPNGTIKSLVKNRGEIPPPPTSSSPNREPSQISSPSLAAEEKEELPILVSPHYSKNSKREPSLNPNIPPETANPLIARRLEDGFFEPTIDESINILTTCITYGQFRAQKLAGKEGIIIIGNTGAGKSTLVNYLYGCQMQNAKVQDLLQEDPTLKRGDFLKKKVIRVHPDSPVEEVMRIGHTKKSMTFMPDIIQDRKISQIAYCDCPGFLDSRGAEINIANAVNIKNTLSEANQIKVLILINSESLTDGRGKGFKDMIQIACDLFGSRENLLRHKDSLLLGITQIRPFNPNEDEEPEPLEVLKERIQSAEMGIFDKAALEELSNRLFIYDPLDRTDLEYEGALTREPLLEKIQNLTPITNPSAIFRTVLTPTDEKRLLEISRKMGIDIEEALLRKDFPQAASRLRHLESLTVIDHKAIRRILSDNFYLIGRHLQELINTFKDNCAFEHFEEAQLQLEELKAVLESFQDKLGETIDLEKLQNHKRKMETRYQTHLQEKREAQEKLQANEEKLLQAQKEMQKMQTQFYEVTAALKLLETQRAFLERQTKLLEAEKDKANAAIKAQKEEFDLLLKRTQTEIQETKDSYLQMQQDIRKEMDEKLAEKELSLSSATQEARQEILKQQEELKLEYEKQLRETQEKQDALIREKEKEFEVKQREAEKQLQKAEKERAFQIQRQRENEQRQQVLQAERERLEKERALQAAAIAPTSSALKLPDIAFGKAKWNKYFPEIQVDDVPLPPNIEEILSAPSVFWPNKTVRETHLLVLVPKGLSLNALERLIKTPKGGGCRSRYRYYDDEVKRDFGTQTCDSHWVLMTKDVIPNSRFKTYRAQQDLVQQHARKSKIPYELPTVLDATTAILMHYIDKKELFYTYDQLGSQDTYTRCQERIYNRQRPVAIGGFNRNGLLVNHRGIDSANDRAGVSGAWKFEVYREQKLEKERALQMAAIASTPSALKLPDIAFGKAKWNKYFPEIQVDDVPLPPNIEEILSAPSVFWPNKTVRETHLLVLVPKGLSLNALGELIKTPKGGGYRTEYHNYAHNVKRKLGTQTCDSHWVLMTKDVIPNSLSRTYRAQQDLIQQHAKKSEIPYDFPTALDVTTAILMHYIETKELLKLGPEWTYTLCQEKVGWLPVTIGGFNGSGVDITSGGIDNRGVLGTWKFEVYKEQQMEKERALQMAAIASTPSALKLPDIAFGKAKWNKYFPEVKVDEVPLPQNIEEILSDPSVFWPNKTVRETHLLILVPEGFSLDTLGEFIKTPQGGGNKTQYRIYNEDVKNELGTQTSTAHWVLMTKDVIPNSRLKTYRAQQDLIQQYARKGIIPYELPTALDVTVSILMHYVEIGESLYTDADDQLGLKRTYTRCQEKIDQGQSPVVIGGFNTSGVSIEYNFYGSAYASYGVAGACKFEVYREQQPEKERALQAAAIVSTPSALKLPDIAFGKAEWERYYGSVGVEPALPPNIDEILNTPCPYWGKGLFSRKKVRDTHLLVLIPRIVDGKPLTLNSLGEMIKNPKRGGRCTNYRYKEEHSKNLKQFGKKDIPTSYWILMTKDVIPNSRNKTFDEQISLLKESGRVPTSLEAAVTVLMHQARTGEKLYSDKPMTYTWCKEKVDGEWPVVVGGFGPSGLTIGNVFGNPNRAFGLGVVSRIESL